MRYFVTQNRFGYFPWEWDKFSWWQKLRMHFDAFRCPSHHLCSFIKARAEIWRGRIPTDEFDCKCGDSDEREFNCWCHCSNGVLRQGKFNRKGEKVEKHEYQF